MALCLVLLVSTLALALGLPTEQILRKLDDTRFQYIRAGDGTPHLVDLWMTPGDLAETARYEPDRQNVYHLFTRLNPTVSQPLLMGNEGLLGITNYNPQRRTVILMHGWLDDVGAEMNSVLLPAFLAAEDLNVIVVDWSSGANTINYAAAVSNTSSGGRSIARFINWLNSMTGAVPAMYHLAGHSLGGHMAGIVGRHLDRPAAYVTALDAAFPGWITNDDRLRPSDATYTEAIHTNIYMLGYAATLADADFYPNGGADQPGCNSNECDHRRSYFFFAESLRTGGFTGRRCASYATAILNQCYLLGRLRMGGLVPKTGSSGVYYVETNSSPPFSRG